MSLINEALKKAQRSRGNDAAGETAAPFGEAGPVAKRGKARSSQTIMLIASGAIVLVVLTVVATFWFANRPTPQPERVVAKQPAPKITPASEAAQPIVVPPVNPPPVATAPTPAPNPSPAGEEKSPKAEETKTAEPATTTAESKSGATSGSPTPATTPTTPPASGTTAASTPTAPVAPPPNPTPTTTPPPTGTPATAAAGKQDERIAAYVEGLRITAIRANDAKIIMNEKVYRVNDIVERNLGVRLVKVDADSLTFADANGVTYVKYF